MSHSKRLPYLDILKGLGILLVILGHSVPDYPINLRADVVSATLESVIYGFHMPLFFICAGYLLQMTDGISGDRNGRNISSDWFSKKAKRLLIPYAAFSFFSLVLRWIFSAFTRSSVDIGRGIYGIIFEGKYFWFLYVMFIVLATIKVFKTQKIKIRWQYLIAVVFYLIGLYIQSPFMCFDRLGYYLIYTLLGMTIYDNKDNVDKLFSKWYTPWAMVCIFIIFYTLRLSDYLLLKEFCRFGMAVTGVGVTYHISVWINNNCKTIKNLLSYFGKMSLQYYLVHMIIQLPIYYLVAKFNFHIPILSVLLIFLITTVLTYFIVEVMSLIPICRTVLGLPSKK